MTTTTTTTQAKTTTSTTSTTVPSSTTTIAEETTTSSVAATHQAEDAPAVGVFTDATAQAADPIVGETIAAGIDPACTDGCPQTKVYAMYLMAVAVVGGAISWWAFRS